MNRERQAVEARIFREAAQQVDEWPDELRERRAYVVAGEGWHEGVIGIVASRLVERFNRPVVLIAGTDGDWKGSGRSIPSFDLHAALGACSALLGRWGLAIGIAVLSGLMTHLILGDAGIAARLAVEAMRLFGFGRATAEA